MNFSARIRNKLLYRFALPYLLILLIPLLSGFLIYQRTLHLVEEDATQSNLSILEHSRMTLDTRLAEIDNFAQKLVSDPKVLQFQYVNNPISSQSMGQVLDLIKKLADFKPINSFVFDYYILYKGSEVALSNHTIYGLSEFYQRHMLLDGVSFEIWRAEALEPFYYQKYLPARSITHDGERQGLVTVIRSLGYPNYSPGAAIILIREKELKELVSGLDVSDSGWAYIADERGKRITHLSRSGVSGVDLPRVDLPADSPNGIFRKTIDGRDMLVTFTKSSYNDWTYVAVQPANVILEKVNYIRDVTMFFFALSLLLGGLISLLLAYRGSKPMGGLIGALTEHFGEELPKAKGMYPFLKTAVSHMIHSHKQLRDKVGEQLPLLQAALLERLLRNGFVNEDELEANLSHAGLTIRAPYYAVAIVQFLGYYDRISKDILDELALKRLHVREKLELALEGRIYVLETKEDRLLLLLLGDQETAAGCKAVYDAKLTALAQSIRHEVNGELAFARGTFYDKRMDIARSYDEAKQALVYAKPGFKGAVLTYEDLPSPVTPFYFPVEVETRLGTLTRVGETDQIERLFLELETANFNDRRLSFEMLRLFIYQLWGCLVKVGGELPRQEPDVQEQLKMRLKQLESYEDCHSEFRQLRDEFLRLCSAVAGRKKSHNSELLQRVLESIQASFSLESLTLLQIARSLQVSEVYLSQFFKEQTGETFTAYLERKRMERAMELLNETDIPVKEIAALVGYGSSNTFGRAFKRVYGTNATAVRSAAALASTDSAP